MLWKTENAGASIYVRCFCNSGGVTLAVELDDGPIDGARFCDGCNGVRLFYGVSVFRVPLVSSDWNPRGCWLFSWRMLETL